MRGFGQGGVYGQPDMEPLRLHHLMARHPMTGGQLPAQVGGSYMPAFNPQTGGQLPPQLFQPMTGGALQAQSGYPQGLAAMFRGYSPYRFG